jgi:hypothetical protein
MEGIYNGTTRDRGMKEAAHVSVAGIDRSSLSLAVQTRLGPPRQPRDAVIYFAYVVKTRPYKTVGNSAPLRLVLVSIQR